MENFLQPLSARLGIDPIPWGPGWTWAMEADSDIRPPRKYYLFVPGTYGG